MSVSAVTGAQKFNSTVLCQACEITYLGPGTRAAIDVCMKTKFTKVQAMQALEKHQLGFIANVIMCGCSKPTKKMTTLVHLLEAGHAVTLAQFDNYVVIINGVDLALGNLDMGMEAVLKAVELKRAEWSKK